MTACQNLSLVRAASFFLLLTASTVGFAQESDGRDEQFRRSLFPNAMVRLGRADADLLGALHDFDTEFPCRFYDAIRGHFTSTAATDAIVNAHCGESHAENWGSTLFAQLRDGRWTVRWRQTGLITSYCSLVEFPDGRDGLLCADRDTHMGEREDSLYTIDLVQPPKQCANPVLSIVDTEATGWPNATTFIESSIERIEMGSRLSVWVRYGEVPVALRNQPRAPARTYRLDFRLHGTQYVPEAGTIPMLRQIDERFAKRTKASP